MGRDHAELPDDFQERAAAIEENHMANPVKEELRGDFVTGKEQGL